MGVTYYLPTIVAKLQKCTCWLQTVLIPKVDAYLELW